MRIKTLISLLPLVYGLIFLGLAEAESVSLAKAVIEQSKYNFGEVAEGTKVEHSFIIKNKGNAALMIHNTIPSCGCTVSKLSAETIAPGEQASIDVKFDTTGFSGRKAKTVRVMTSDLTRDSLVVTLSGVIVPDVSVEPSRVFIKSISKSKIENLEPRKIVAVVNANSDAEITDVINTARNFQITKVEGDKKKKTIWIAPQGEFEVGQIRERVLLKLKNAERESINIPIFVNITSELEILPGVISFGLIEGEKPIKKTIKINNHSLAPVKVLKHSSEHPALTSTLREINDGKNYLLDVTLDPTKVDSRLNSDIRILTDQKDNSEIIISVFGILPPTELL